MKIKEETDDLIILAENPNEFKITLLFSLITTLVFILLSQLSGGNIFFGIMVFIGISGILMNSYNLYRNESIIVDKKGSNIVINKFHSSHKIPFSNIKRVNIEKQSGSESPDIWSVSISMKYTPDVPWWFEGSLYIYGSFDESEAERFAEKISKITNRKISCEN